MNARLPRNLRRRSAVHAQFEAAMNSGAPIVDMIGDGRMQYDGPRCDRCGEPVDNDGQLCGDCAPCPVCHGNGGWQQHDGLIIECPRGCMVGGAA